MCTSYMTAERECFPIKDFESKSEWCKCSKWRTIGIEIAANGNIEAVRHILHIFTADVSDHEHWWIQRWKGCSEKHMVILKSYIFCLIITDTLKLPFQTGRKVHHINCSALWWNSVQSSSFLRCDHTIKQLIPGVKQDHDTFAFRIFSSTAVRTSCLTKSHWACCSSVGFVFLNTAGIFFFNVMV
jgi:hypothetical protein